jgi:hypothetical protein
MQGAYLYFHRYTPVRTGSACGAESTFEARGKGNAKSSALLRAEDYTQFGLRFPSRVAWGEGKADGVARGVHEELEHRAAIAFDRGDANATDLLCGCSLFIWPEHTLRKIDAVKFRGMATRKQKQLQMLAYLFELLYELCLDPSDDASMSPGFETPLGCF